MRMPGKKCIWCGGVCEGKYYCDVCKQRCFRECKTCHKPYPSINNFPSEESLRCKSCQKRHVTEKEKRLNGLSIGTNYGCGWPLKRGIAKKEFQLRKMSQEMSQQKGFGKTNPNDITHQHEEVASRITKREKNRQAIELVSTNSEDEEEDEDEDQDDEEDGDEEEDQDDDEEEEDVTEIKPPQLIQQIAQSKQTPSTQPRRMKKASRKLTVAAQKEIQAKETKIEAVLSTSGNTGANTKTSKVIKAATTTTTTAKVTKRAKKAKIEQTPQQKNTAKLLASLGMYNETAPDKCVITIRM